MGYRSVDVAVVEECRVEQYAVMVKQGSVLHPLGPT